MPRIRRIQISITGYRYAIFTFFYESQVEFLIKAFTKDKKRKTLFPNSSLYLYKLRSERGGNPPTPMQNNLAQGVM
jgi:hypothetical protein